MSAHTNIEVPHAVNTFWPGHFDVWGSILIWSYPELATITFPELVQYFASTSSSAALITVSSLSLCLSFSVHLLDILSHTLTCRAASAVNHPSGSQVNLPGFQMCRIVVLPSVKSPHYGPKAKPRKWMRLLPLLFPVPHDPLTSFSSVCTSMPPSPIMGYNNRTNFNQPHWHTTSFLRAMDLLLPVNPLMLRTPF